MSTEAELQALSAQWRGIRDREERNAFYSERVFPAIKAVVVPREQIRQPLPYDGLIMPVGLVPEPLILSLLILRPKKVYLLYTRGSEQYLDRIVAEAGLRISQVDKDEIDETNVPDIYQRVKLIHAKWGPEARVAVDISGGKKSMVGGCALAGALIGAHLFYMDSEFIQELRRPQPGSERLMVLENPYDVFGDLKLRRALELFEQLDYVGAHRLLEELQSQTSTPEVYTARAGLCQAYAAWDDWQLNEAVAAMRQVIDTVERFNRREPATPLAGQLPRLRAQLDVMTRLSEAQAIIQTNGSELQVLSEPRLYLSLLVTLRAGALRQEKRGKLDVAALLWYRIIEFLSQRRLSTYGLATGAPDYVRTGRDLEELLHRFQKELAQGARQRPGEGAPLGLPEEIDLLKGYALLKALDDPMTGADLNLGRIRGKISARNKGLFAHGFAPISPKDYAEFKTLAEQLLDGFLHVEGLPASTWDDGVFLEAL